MAERPTRYIQLSPQVKIVICYVQKLGKAHTGILQKTIDEKFGCAERTLNETVAF
jgi:hypothetical protein